MKVDTANTGVKPKAYSYLRFSTADQMRGDSLRRQTTLARAWCEKHKVRLVENYRDLGVSAFRGANADKGALKAFLEKIESGEIERGAYLIVESLDRLSRTDITYALSMFLNIINSGVIVVTLGDDKAYDREKINNGNFTDLIISLTILSRANEESRTKSRRVAEAWANKRTETDKIKLTKRCVAWLKLSADRKIFHLIPDRVEIVRQIFSMAENGKGAASITKTLNSRLVPTFGRSKVWFISYVKKILSNPAVIGEFTPAVKRDGKRIFLNPIPGYYPAVISKENWATVQRLREARPSYSGRSQFNIFTKLWFDRTTGCPMAYVNKNRDKGWHYAVSRDAVLGLAPYHSWQYDEFMNVFLFVCRKASRRCSKRVADNSALSLARFELTNVEKQIGNLVNVISHGYSQSVERTLRSLEKSKDELAEKVRQLESSVAAKPCDWKNIDWNDSECLRDNLRATIRRIDVDAKEKWFRAELLDGSYYIFWIKDGTAHIESDQDPVESFPKKEIELIS